MGLLKVNLQKARHIFFFYRNKSFVINHIRNLGTALEAQYISGEDCLYQALVGKYVKRIFTREKIPPLNDMKSGENVKGFLPGRANYNTFFIDFSTIHRKKLKKLKF